MPGFKTYNHTDQPMWVTIYTVGGVIKEDWGNVDAGTAREWQSGHYAHGSYYKVRGQWPTIDSKFDTDTTKAVDAPTNPRELVLVGGASGVYWSDPIVRVDNQSGWNVWITIYTGSTTKTDWGSVEKGSTRDWSAGGPYGSGVILTLLAEWEEPSATTLNRDGQETPPSSPQKHSVQFERMFGKGGNGISNSRLVLKDKEVIWVNLDE